MKKEEIVEEYRPLVVDTAKRCYARYKRHNSISLDDMISMGFIGLLEAAGHFDNTRRNRFATFAYNRIRGNILDETNKFLSTRSMKKYSISFVNMSDQEIDEFPDINAKNITNEIYKKEILSYVDYIAERFLTDKEKEAINLKYKTGFNHEEIAKKMGVSKQRVSTILRVAIEKIKKRIHLYDRQKTYA